MTQFFLPTSALCALLITACNNKINEPNSAHLNSTQKQQINELKSSGSETSGIPSACQALMASINDSRNLKTVKFQDVYQCGPDFSHEAGAPPKAVDGCLVSFERDNSPFPNYTVSAFIDVSNKHQVNWILKGLGSEVSGRHLCADVKTYARLQGEGDLLTVEIERKTASDAMFCPFGKIFSAYSTTCRRIQAQ
jgi:hypothetical protein